MEKRFPFFLNQEEGERTTAEYITCTFSYHTAKEEVKQISEIEDPEGWKEARRKEEKLLETIRQFQQTDIITRFTNIVRKEEKRISKDKQRKIMKNTLKEMETFNKETLLETSPPILPTREGLQI